MPFVSGLEVGQCLFRNPFCKHVYTPVITLTRYAGLFHMALAVFLPLMDGNGFSTDLVKAYAISDSHSRLRNGPFKVRVPNHCPAAVLSLHADEETLTLLGIETVSGSAELKKSRRLLRLLKRALLSRISASKGSTGTLLRKTIQPSSKEKNDGPCSLLSEPQRGNRQKPRQLHRGSIPYQQRRQNHLYRLRSRYPYPHRL